MFKLSNTTIVITFLKTKKKIVITNIFNHILLFIHKDQGICLTNIINIHFKGPIVLINPKSLGQTILSFQPNRTLYIVLTWSNLYILSFIFQINIKTWQQTKNYSNRILLKISQLLSYHNRLSLLLYISFYYILNSFINIPNPNTKLYYFFSKSRLCRG